MSAASRNLVAPFVDRISVLFQENDLSVRGNGHNDHGVAPFQVGVLNLLSTLQLDVVFSQTQVVILEVGARFLGTSNLLLLPPAFPRSRPSAECMVGGRKRKRERRRICALQNQRSSGGKRRTSSTQSRQEQAPRRDAAAAERRLHDACDRCAGTAPDPGHSPGTTPARDR